MRGDQRKVILTMLKCPILYPCVNPSHISYYMLCPLRDGNCTVSNFIMRVSHSFYISAPKVCPTSSSPYTPINPYFPLYHSPTPFLVDLNCLNIKDLQYCPKILVEIQSNIIGHSIMTNFREHFTCIIREFGLLLDIYLSPPSAMFMNNLERQKATAEYF